MKWKCPKCDYVESYPAHCQYKCRRCGKDLKLEDGDE